MTLEKEILEEFIEKEKKEWISDNSLLFNKEELERLIQLTQSKIIQIIDKRVEELKNPTIICPKCGEEVYFPENRREIEELQSLKKSLLSEKEKRGIITIHSVEVVTPELISKHMFSEKIPTKKEVKE